MNAPAAHAPRKSRSDVGRSSLQDGSKDDVTAWLRLICDTRRCALGVTVLHNVSRRLRIERQPVDNIETGVRRCGGRAGQLLVSVPARFQEIVQVRCGQGALLATEHEVGL